MLISIAIERTQPLTGTASADDMEPISFVGWMALLRVVAKLAESMDESTGSGREADETPAIETPAIQTMGNGSLS